MASNTDKGVGGELRSTGSLWLDGLKFFSVTYGPHASSFVFLILIWMMLVKPELDRKELDYSQHREMISLMSSQTQSQQELVRSIDATAKTMQVTATALDRLFERIQDER